MHGALSPIMPCHIIMFNSPPHTHTHPTHPCDCLARLVAVGRDAVTKDLGLEAAGVAFNASSGKIAAVDEQTNVPHIYAIGDVLESRQASCVHMPAACMCPAIS